VLNVPSCCRKGDRRARRAQDLSLSPESPDCLDLVLCGHSFGVSVSRSLAQHLEVSGWMLRGLVALDQRVRTALDSVPGCPQAHHLATSSFRLASLGRGFAAS
jgi:alpha/beta superfamily hydrolase